ncbi:ABC transporter ATP-binding protein [Arachnia propionica]|jgi:ABC transporter, ATP-binding protein|uniref:ABC transporter ATP-binding protein n=1 Tax=Arachnia propionica TaxID=1750 RepID=A0A3N4D0D5_9ACTN|nr:ABC transporter ATP-binding protein [Arachnia propionica]QCT38434.1 ABC transporter ATP-binding protein [Arachnia propionica]QUC11975.1 ABC transporter ATP-binding protein [Arachnia propionica]QUC13332.1 ABC transporter ATP-binding protein [Arachnia propionica]RPA18781.1 ABC transporter ATP-binding protein [Arachnia propionica]VEH70884.1 Lipoprotein-releasing system ATP-binding protein LolD [Arachnia propionica]
MASLITTEKLSKTFSRKGSQHHVLKNIDLEIDGADFTVVMGPSGAGKSTLLYALSGMDRPSLGRIVFDGQNIEKMSEDKLARFRLDHCGFVFQQVYLLDSLSVSDNVLAVGLLGSRRRREIVERAGELFDRVGLPERTRVAAATTLSGGEAQRAGIVRALIREPRVLFADEPTGQLNSEASDAVLDLLSDLHAGGQCILMVTHDVRSALRGSRILYLRDGVIAGDLKLGRFDRKDSGRRERLQHFLEEMGW